MKAKFTSRLLAAAVAGMTATATASAQDTQPRATPPVAQAAEPLPRPWQVGDPAPSVEGVHLGDSQTQVIAVLGDPAPPPAGLDNAQSVLRTLRFRGGGLLIAIGDTGVVTRIMLLKQEGGSIAGVRVGDRLGHVVRLWGEPTAGAGSTGKWPMGDWVVSVRADMVSNLALRITLARAPSQAVPPPTSTPAP